MGVRNSRYSLASVNIQHENESANVPRNPMMFPVSHVFSLDGAVQVVCVFIIGMRASAVGVTGYTTVGCTLRFASLASDTSSNHKNLATQ